MIAHDVYGEPIARAVIARAVKARAAIARVVYVDHVDAGDRSPALSGTGSGA
ncbi:hypothetical protein OHB41_18080 [Streptomyces sp. NBC_01571]|uniref:hypothetical protein n=1 Tax=Streptomyces sp. NBC_01571 TaxID=2975883 RepID=UPI00225243DC|nr:hypothetical protein [Streptomyces sp. NBC_01571]MCX4575061.1 hypothetical protein [Streptomyces sp. NBC_01571]